MNARTHTFQGGVIQIQRQGYSLKENNYENCFDMEELSICKKKALLHYCIPLSKDKNS